MLIPLGFWAASAGGGAAAGSFDLLETQVLASSAASVSFTSLSTYAADYQHLQIRMRAKTDRTSAAADYCLVNLNGDTGSNYAVHALRGTGSAVNSFAITSQTRMLMVRVAGNANADVFGAGVIDILDAFNTSKNKTLRALGGETNLNEITLHSGLYMNTAAITTFAIKPEIGTNFLTGSRFSLYGIKAG